MAEQALAAYKGRTLLYVGEQRGRAGGQASISPPAWLHGWAVTAGESRGGVNASPKFFDALQQDWECTQTVEVEPFPGAHGLLAVPPGAGHGV
jgi:hypothetical protein